ncbi:Imm59 family immunity protein [Loigolactobacillus binensis]|uniref:Imm59 family immunity protein n=1 Tax=Loigolactobacillus binensis TaxID=2559922 RepID=A0ABW3EDE3_9LACO|nr:Imm59 family immunity protein [Loigolactobacillus binensis]
MSPKEAKKIIKKEKLAVNWFNKHNLRPFEMVINKNKDGRYQVYGTGERANIWGIAATFENEEEALDNLISRARL